MAERTIAWTIPRNRREPDRPGSFHVFEAGGAERVTKSVRDAVNLTDADADADFGLAQAARQRVAELVDTNRRCPAA